MERKTFSSLASVFIKNDCSFLIPKKMWVEVLKPIAPSGLSQVGGLGFNPPVFGQSTLSQPGGILSIPTRILLAPPPGFSDLATALPFVYLIRIHEIEVHRYLRT